MIFEACSTQNNAIIQVSELDLIKRTWLLSVLKGSLITKLRRKESVQQVVYQTM